MRRAATVIFYAPVAQLDRALDSDSKGRTFESCRAYQIKAGRTPSVRPAFALWGGIAAALFGALTEKGELRCGRSQKKGICDAGDHRKKGIAMRALTEKGDRDAGAHGKKGDRDAGAHEKRGIAMRALTEKGDRDAGAHGKRGIAMRALTEKGNCDAGARAWLSRARRRRYRADNTFLFSRSGRHDCRAR